MQRLPAILPETILEARLTELMESVAALDEAISERMPEASSLRDMMEVLRRIPVEPAKPPASAEPMAPVEPATPATIEASRPESTSTSQTVLAQSPNLAQPAAPAASNDPAPAPPTVSGTSPSPVLPTATPQPTAPPQGESLQPLAQEPGATATPVVSSFSDETLSLRAAFVEATRRYAFSAHKDSPQFALPWQLLRIAFWGKVHALPPSEEGQTALPPPDPQRLEALEALLNGGKALQAALGAEELFADSLFCLDLQSLIARALGFLGASYAVAAATVEQETAAFVRRLAGVEQLRFSDGRPFASEQTLIWLRDIVARHSRGDRGHARISRAKNLESESNAASGGFAAEVLPPRSGGAALSEAAVEEKRQAADALFQSGDLHGALDALTDAMGESGGRDMRLRLHQLDILGRAGESQAAFSMGRLLLEELDERNLEDWDKNLTVESLTHIRHAFLQALKFIQDTDEIRDAEKALERITRRLLRLRPSSVFD